MRTGINALFIDDFWIGAHESQLKLNEFPCCCFCGRKLRMGSAVDALWPNFNEYSYHLGCHKKDMLCRTALRLLAKS